MSNIATTKGPRPNVEAKEIMEGIVLLAMRLCNIKGRPKTPLREWLRVKPALAGC
jgi:hypothetical protein